MALYIISRISACASMVLGGEGGEEGRCLGFRHLELTGKEAKMSLEALGYGRMQTTSTLRTYICGVHREAKDMSNTVADLNR